MNAGPEVVAGAKLAAPFISLLGVSGVSIAVFDQERRASVVHASDAVAARLEELHFDLGEGPMLDTFASGSRILVPDTTETDRWPTYLGQAASLDARGIFVFPLLLGAAGIGAVLCYCTTAGPLGEGDEETGDGLGRAIAGPAFRLAIARAAMEVPDGEEPIETRREVHQATGMVTMQLGIGASDAFARLRAHAYASGRSLTEIAGDVIARRLDFAVLEERSE